MEQLQEGIDFVVEKQDIVAISQLGNEILGILVANHTYPFTEYMCTLTPDSKQDSMVVNLRNYDGLLDKAREALTTYSE